MLQLEDYDGKPELPEDMPYVPASEEIVVASYAQVRWIVDNHAFRCFTWPNDPEGFEPLLVDGTTANMLVLIHDAICEENQAKMERLIAKHRAHFINLVEFSWKQVSFGGGAA